MMKKTKYIVLVLMLMVLGSGFYSCSSDSYESQLKELLIYDLKFGSGAETQKIVLRGPTIRFRHCILVQGMDRLQQLYHLRECREEYDL